MITRRKALTFLLVPCLACALSGSAFSERMPVPEGTPTWYPSPSGRFGLKAVEPSGCSMMEGAKVLWSDPFLDVSKGAVSDDGERAVVTLWGWKDEAASEAIVFYDGKGASIAKLSFGVPGGRAMKWVKRLALSPDGSLCALGENGKEKALVTLYDARKGAFLWERGFGLEEIVGIAFQPSGRNLLLATRGGGTRDMVFLLTDERGRILWKRRIDGNFTYEAGDLCRFSANGKSVEVYVDAERRYLAFPVPDADSP